MSGVIFVSLVTPSSSLRACLRGENNKNRMGSGTAPFYILLSQEGQASGIGYPASSIAFVPVRQAQGRLCLFVVSYDIFFTFFDIFHKKYVVTTIVLMGWTLLRLLYNG